MAESSPHASAGEPVEFTPASAAHAFRCETCAAEVRWDPDQDALLCEHCGTTRPVPRGDGTILERPLAEAGSAARGLGLELRVSRCDGCGARVAFAEAATSERCSFCGGSQVLAQEANRNALRPESLIPLDVGRAAVEEGFRSWLKGLWFRPGDLRRARTHEAVGIYVPFWTFDCRVHSDWSADAGYYYWVTVPHVTVVNGKPRMTMRRERRIRWEPAWGARDDAYDDLLVGASTGVPADLLEELGGFDTAALLPYRPEYLAGFRAEEYALDLEQAWHAGQARIEERQQARCAGDVPGDTHRRLSVRNAIADVRWKHVLLPVWCLAYRHRGKAYRVLVHGQTGRVVGRAPYSWVKILLAVLAVLGAGGAIALVAAR